MIIDVDDLSWRFSKIIAEHLFVAVLLHKYDFLKRPDAYNKDFNEVDGATSITPTPSASDIKIPISTSDYITSCHTEPITTSSLAFVPIQSTAASPTHDKIRSVPILLHYSPIRECHSTLVDDNDTARPLLQIIQNSICTWVFLDDVLGSFLSWYQYDDSDSIE